MGEVFGGFEFLIDGCHSERLLIDYLLVIHGFDLFPRFSDFEFRCDSEWLVSNSFTILSRFVFRFFVFCFLLLICRFDKVNKVANVLVSESPP